MKCLYLTNRSSSPHYGHEHMLVHCFVTVVPVQCANPQYMDAVTTWQSTSNRGAGRFLSLIELQESQRLRRISFFRSRNPNVRIRAVSVKNQQRSACNQIICNVQSPICRRLQLRYYTSGTSLLQVATRQDCDRVQEKWEKEEKGGISFDES